MNLLRARNTEDVNIFLSSPTANDYITVLLLESITEKIEHKDIKNKIDRCLKESKVLLNQMEI